MARRRMSQAGSATCAFIMFLCGITVLSAGAWLASKHSQDCIKFLERPEVALGILIMVVALLGILAALTGLTGLTLLYVVLMFLLILTLLAFTVFAYVVTRGGESHLSIGKAYVEFRFEDYSDWMRNRAEGEKRWAGIRTCLMDSRVCEEFSDRYRTLTQLNNAEISPVESGCCKPPDACKFVFRNSTSWSNPLYPSATDDCKRWSNDNLCYDCSSCKAGILQQMKHHWRTIAVINTIVLGIMFLAFSLQACAFRGY